MSESEGHQKRNGLCQSITLSMVHGGELGTLDEAVELLLEGTSCFWKKTDGTPPFAEVSVIGSRVELDAVQARYDGEFFMEYGIWARNVDQSELHKTAMITKTETQARSLIAQILTQPTCVAEAEYRWREVGPWNHTTSISL